jgi:ABC transport system ATP-binding/permease protein
MTEILLNAILNLFALQASTLAATGRQTLREVLERYLRGHLKLWNVVEYIELFDMALELQEHLDIEEKVTRTEDIAGQLGVKMPLREQYVFLLHYLQPVGRLPAEDSARRLTDVTCAAMAVDPAQVDALGRLYIHPFSQLPTTSAFLIKEDKPTDLLRNPHSEPTCARIDRPDFHGAFIVLHLSDVNLLLVAADPGQPISLDSAPLHPGCPQPFNPGAILSDSRGNRVYYGEVNAALHCREHGKVPDTRLWFQAQNLDFRYPGSDNGLHDFSFDLTGGMLCGVMGVSGAGKSTLLNILNGQVAPDSGRLLVNGVDLHREPGRLEGVIGYVPQDDLLFEELSVFDNLYYNASLCMAHISDEARKKRVNTLLDELQQLNIRDLKVGSPLQKTISGGQRKRLNIALELIREPAILFVDEPTSGLSSSDSENVMALLKAQAAKGRLVIVVIHQPSSRIFKMFDRLWIMDQGGRPIYDGNPLDAIVHFRSQVFQASMGEYACPSCGSVNPEQLFEIIEARAVGPDGLYTRERLVSPEQWRSRFQASKVQQPSRHTIAPDSAPGPAPDSAMATATDFPEIERRLQRPSWFGQLRIFFLRTLKGRLANGQYLLVNLLEPPVLALLAALISLGAWGADYSFMDNRNISTFFFISVIVALFLGMSVSAEEINRDQKILKRESFLNLSWSGYITAKTLYLMALVALQMALFVIVGNTVLGVPNMNVPTWIVLFSCAAASCVLGLNISAAFKSAVTIYILIPLLLVPQMMLGGAVIPLDDLLHRQAGHRNTPLVANMMPSRWGYEALVVHQYLTNEYTSRFLPWKLIEAQNNYLINVHIPEMRALADYPLLAGNADNQAEVARRLAALRDEIHYVEELSGLPSPIDPARLEPGNYGPEIRNMVKAWLDQAAAAFRANRAEASAHRRAQEDRLREEHGRDGLAAIQQRHFNQEIADLVMNVKSLESVRLSGERLVQVASPIAKAPESAWGAAHFFAAHKHLGTWTVPTYGFNIAVLWLMAGVLFATLYGKILPRLFAVGRSAMQSWKQSSSTQHQPAQGRKP